MTKTTPMLSNSKAFSSFAVTDITRAKHFYGTLLGLKVTDSIEGIIEIHIKNSTPVIAYPKPDHEPAAFTVLNFPVPDIVAAVAHLKSRGIVFENYDMDGLTTDDDNIFRGGGPHIAWFKDPAGNILSVLQE